MSDLTTWNLVYSVVWMYVQGLPMDTIYVVLKNVPIYFEMKQKKGKEERGSLLVRQ